MSIKFFFFITVLLCACAIKAQPFAYILAGTYDSGSSKGIFIYKFNYKTGEATKASNNTDISNASYITTDEKTNTVYAVSEHTNAKAKVFAFAFNRITGILTKKMEAQAGGDHPCYIAISPKDNIIATANYSSGSASIFKINSGLDTNIAAQIIQHKGKSINATRQAAPHVHTTNFDAYGNCWVADLGTDSIHVYAWKNNAMLQIAAIKMAAGSGPRHIAFSKKLRHAYSVNELDATVSLVDYTDINNLQLKQIQSLVDSVVSEDEGAADIHISPDGTFLYASIRGRSNQIAVLSVEKDGWLTRIKNTNTMGQKPRNFFIDKTGKYLFIANENSNTIMIFTINKKTGIPAYTGKHISLPKPVCIKMMYGF